MIAVCPLSPYHFHREKQYLAYHNKNKIRRVNLKLPGGGALGAEQAGMLARVMLDETIEINAISGVSAGLINGATTTQIFNENGYTPESRQKNAQKLRNKWVNRIATDAFSAAAMQMSVDMTDTFDTSIQAMHDFHKSSPFGFITGMAISSISTARNNRNRLNSALFSQMVDKIISNPNALQETKNVSLYGEAVNVFNNKGRIFHPHEITKQVLVASAALPKFFTPQLIEGEHYADGACPGGSNAATEPFEWSGGEADATLCLSPNPPYSEYQTTDPRSLNKDDLNETDGLILTQGLWPLMKQIKDFENGLMTTPSHVLFRNDGEIKTPKDKMNNSTVAIRRRFDRGFQISDIFLKQHGETFHKALSHSSQELKNIAMHNNRLIRPLVAA